MKNSIALFTLFFFIQSCFALDKYVIDLMQKHFKLSKLETLIEPESIEYPVYYDKRFRDICYADISISMYLEADGAHWLMLNGEYLAIFNPRNVFLTTAYRKYKMNAVRFSNYICIYSYEETGDFSYYYLLINITTKRVKEFIGKEIPEIIFRKSVINNYIFINDIERGRYGVATDEEKETFTFDCHLHEIEDFLSGSAPKTIDSTFICINDYYCDYCRRK